MPFDLNFFSLVLINVSATMLELGYMNANDYHYLNMRKANLIKKDLLIHIHVMRIQCINIDQGF